MVALSVVLVVLVLLGVISILWVAGRQSRTRVDRPVDPTTALRVTRIVAVVYAAASVVGTFADALPNLFSPTVRVRLPVESFWPSLPSTVQLTGTTADVVGGGFNYAMVSVNGLDAATRVWLTASDVLQGATNVVIGVVVAVLCTSILRLDPFRPALTRGINLTAIAIIVGGLGWQVCDAVAGGLASAQVLGATGSSLDTSKVDWNDVRQIIGLPGVGQDWVVDFWPIWIGLTLFAVSAAFRYGQRLQQDNAGLI